MPGIQTPPPRLLVGRLVVYGKAPDGLDRPEATVPFALDLARVYGVRAAYDFKNDVGERAGRCIVDTRSDAFTVEMAVADVIAAWRAWREHADALSRIRN